MEQMGTNKYWGKNRPLNWEERIQIKTLQREGYFPKALGKFMDG